MRSLLKRFCTNKKGATAIEYGLIAAGIAVVIIGAVTVLGERLELTFESVSNQMPTTATTDQTE